MKEAFELLDTIAKKMGLTVNEITTKYMVAGLNIPCNTKVNNSTVLLFGRVHQSVYLGSFLTNDNGIGPQVEARLCAAINSYFGLQRQLCSRLLSKRNKIVLDKILTHLVCVYSPL